MRIVDTHLHLVHMDRFTYPWLDGAGALNRAWPAEAFAAEAQKLGIEAALHMEVDVAEADMEAETRYALEVNPLVVGAIAACRPESSDFPAYLDRLAALKGVKGFRRVLHTSPDELSQGQLFRANLRRLADKHLPFDLCVLSKQLPVGRALVESCPGVQFVLDHCGVPDVAAQALDPWRREIKALAALPNVVAKISGIVAYAGPDWATATLRPFVEHIIESFGWDRVVWGSDYPVLTLTADLSRWVAATKEIVAGASPDEQAKLFHRNAERIYRI
ncbi:amidohydrolase [Devosia sp. Root413D1]|uniref:amidohydrolase family protein n=1 Tax=Devosia sp. Root413D1 TaxID=1736531 RepID=UPI0006FDB33A|nr:amidohydrolase [Devosia sp. Root413D1]KQW78012.1 amidohydrolase [Devosia sp. Root413D1]